MRSKPRAGRLRCDGEAVLGRRDRVLEHGVEPEATEALGERGPARDRSGHRDRPRAGLLDRALRIRAQRRRAGGVEPVQLLAVPDLGEEVAADAGRHRLGDAEDRGCGERGVHRVAAPFEGPQAGAGRERLARRHHRLGGDRGRAGDGERRGHPAR